MSPRKSKQKKEPLDTLEVPKEFLNSVDGTFKFNNSPDFLSFDEILPLLDPFPSDSAFCRRLQELTLENDVEKATKAVIETVISGTYDTEAKYIWLICCVSRIFLQKNRSSVNLILQADVFKRYKCDSLYCPAKMHHITGEVYKITRGNTFSILMIVSKLNHINAVLHYLCISLVSAGIKRICFKEEVGNFQPLSPFDLVPILSKMTLASGELDFVGFHELLKLLSLYNCLVVMNKTLHATHSQSLVEYFESGRRTYVEGIKKWLKDSSSYVDKIMQQKKFCSWLVDVKQQILMELQYGMRDSVEEATVYRGPIR